MHRPGFTRAVYFTSVPLRSRISTLSIALYGQVRMQVPQAAQIVSLIEATSGSRVISSWENRICTLPAAADAWATDSGMSLGAWQAPQTNTPAAFVSIGRSLGCDSERNPNSS